MATADPTDLYQIADLLTDDERRLRARVRAFCDERVIPVIADFWERADFPLDLARGLADLGICGETIVGHGCPGLSPVAAGLASMELARGDGSLFTFFAVHSGLVMRAIDLLGSPAQRARWLPGLARLDLIGAFGLTEPDHGSDVVALETRARRDGDAYVLDGAKRWIGNATVADLIVVWARDDAGQVGGFVVERDTPGLAATVITGKASQRAVWQADLQLTGARVPIANRLAGAATFRDTGRVLRAARGGIAWAALGHASACYEAALAYTRQRQQFGRPLASFQLVQEKLARMLAEVTTMQLLCLRLGQLTAAGRVTDGVASLAKLNNAARARQVAATARDLLGGNGILLDYHVARHQADLEALYTYEGTDAIQALIVGREITGLSAFAPR
jgi:glutaryl-CoA dehydrogenase